MPFRTPCTRAQSCRSPACCTDTQGFLGNHPSQHPSAQPSIGICPFLPAPCLAMPLPPPRPWSFSSANSQVTRLSAAFSVLPSTPRGPHLHPEGAAGSRLRHAEGLSHQAATHTAIEGQPGRVLLWERGSAEGGWGMRRGPAKGPSSHPPACSPHPQTHHGWRE